MPANFNNQILFRSSSAASGDDNFTMLRTGIVYNAFGIANGATAGTVTVSKAGAAITDAININGGDKTLARAGSTDDAKSAAVSSDTFLYIAATGVSQ